MATNDLNLAALPHPDGWIGKFRPGIRERLLGKWLGRIGAGKLTVEFPSGACRHFGGADDGPNARLTIHDNAFVTRVALGGDMGFAESFISGEWDTPDLPATLKLMAMNLRDLGGAAARSWPITTLNRLRHSLRANTRAGSRRNIAAHYDLGNEFYALWLDETMSYSSAIFEQPDERHEDAQRRKYVRLANALALKPGERVLEIGCGWGGFAEMAAAEFGCEVTAVTLSAEQAVYARDRMARAGLADRVDIRLQDYRDLDGEYDKIASIEMFEAVGQENWPAFFGVLDRRLRPGGRAALQVISIADDAFTRYRRNPDFIQRYIFPGGMLPSPSALRAEINDAGFEVVDVDRFGASYAETLRRWNSAFAASWPEIEKLGFDGRFRRMWQYYLAYCEVGFDLGLTDVGHYVIERA